MDIPLSLTQRENTLIMEKGIRMNKKKDHPVSGTNISISRWIKLLLLLLFLMVIVYGCDEARTTTHFTAISIISLDQLPSDLVFTPITFRKKQDGSVWFYLTTLGGPTDEDKNVEIKGREVEISPDRDYLTYIKVIDTSNGRDDTLSDGISSIWIRDLRDGSERQLIEWPKRYGDEVIAHPHFFPSGDKLIFSIIQFDKNQWNLATINLDGKNLMIIEMEPNTLNAVSYISPDTEKVVVLCDEHDPDSGETLIMFCAMNLDGTERIMLTPDGDMHPPPAVFSPDSQTVYFSEADFGGPLGLIKPPTYELKGINIDGSNVQTILDWRWPVFILAISEDGEDLVFRDGPRYGSYGNLYVVQTNGENLRHLGYFDRFMIDWYADAE